MLNKALLIGNLGSDVVLKDINATTKVANFAIATNEPYKGKDGNWADITTWHNVSLFNPSDFLSTNLKKGTRVYVEGPIRKSDYTKDNQKLQFVRIVADRVRIIDSVEHTASAPVENGGVEDLPF